MSVAKPRGDTAQSEHARDRIEETVRLRATHRTPDEVGDTRSYANMERTLKQEYWGRFLIELLQNARDAWNSAHADATDGVVLVRLTSEPALIVANQGEALRPEVLLDSISKFGESTKEFGTAIGHKGIGFKAVLEISLTPEIYSRASTEGPFDLRARFDPQRARDLIHEMTPDWDTLVSELASAEAGTDPDERIPVLRFPAWIEDPGSWLDEAQQWGGHTFNTVIKLPFDDRNAQTLDLDRPAFIERVRTAMGELSDEIVLLLRSFGTIVLEDEIGGDSQVVRREEVTPSSEHSTPPTETAERYSTVRIARNGVETSRWLLAEEQLSGAGLDEEVAVGVRLLTSTAHADPVDAAADSIALASADPGGLPFHLFFPTRIATHLPFLLHAYFQVDAGRKGFAEDEAPRNLRLLDTLRSLAVRVVRHLATLHDRGQLDITPLADLFAATAGDGDERSAREFREALLSDLDDVTFVPNLSDGDLVAPKDVLADPRANLAALLPKAFPPHYLAEQADLRYASPNVDHAGLSFLAERGRIARGTDAPGLDAEILARLLRPAADQLWKDDIDAGFVALLQVLESLRTQDPALQEVIAAAIGDDTATFVPVSHDEPPYRRLRSPPGAGAGVIMARLRAGEETTLVPPQGLGIDFLGEGALPSGLVAGIANELGIREYTTDAVLDAIAARGDRCDPTELLRFVWRLLLRERRSAFSVAAALGAAQMYQPGTFFWAASGQHGTDPDRARQLRALNAIRLPTRSRTWRPATDLCFGADWADWLASTLEEDVGAASAHRAAAYRDMEAIAPAPDDLLAGPERLSQLLPHIPTDTSWSATEAGPTLPGDSTSRDALLLHVFLLRLGVWEVPPVEAIIDYVDRPAERRDPWSTRPGRATYLGQVREASGQFAAYGHANVHVAEDAALTWPLQTSAAYVRSLGRGSELYEAFRRISLYCPGCKTHTTRYRNLDATDQPSYLLHQLSSAAWVPVELSGRAAMPVHPGDAWLEPDRPDSSRIAQSPLRFLPLASLDLDDRLARLVGIQRLEETGVSRLTGLLRELRRDFADLVPEGDERAGSVTATAFAGLHRQVYERVARLDADVARTIAEELSTLAVRGRRLEYVPPTEARHDDGRWATYKRHFLGRVPFSVLAREQSTTAAALGISRFELSIARIDAGTETNVTEQVRPLVRERAPELLALQVFHPLGGPAVDLSGRTFTERAARLEGLEIIQVDNLVVELQVVGSPERERIGTERDRDVMVENPTTSHPVLYHDLSGPDWTDRLRDVLGHHLAVILENPSYGPLFQLLLQQDDEAQRESFLLEHGVSDDELAQVRAHMGGRDDLEVQRRWWRAVLPMVGAPPFVDGDDPSAAAELALTDAGLLADGGSIGVALLAAGGGADVRNDDDPSGILARVEREGIDLRALDATLRAAGDPGLRIDAAARRLGEWRRSYGREVAALLAARGKPLAAAREAPGVWQVAESARYTVAVQPAAYLGDVLLDLRSVGLEPDADVLAGPDARAHLHALHGDAAEPLDALWERLFGEVDAERLKRERANAWRRTLRVLLTAALTRPEEPSYRIRTEGEIVDRALPQSPSRPEDLMDAVASLLVEEPWLTEAIRRVMEEDERLAVPAVASLTALLRDLVPHPAHLDRVSALLNGRVRRDVDLVRQHVAAVQELNLRPVVAVTTVAGTRPPPPSPGPKRTISGPPRRHDQRLLDRLGADGEQWALAAVVEGLLSLPPAGFREAVAELQGKLASAFTGPIVDGLLRHADEAVAQDADDDDRVEALVAFLHVAKKSDEFGFDMLGWLPAAPNDPPRPLLLEVKNSRDRRLNVSANEWRTAERERGDYAFLIVVRGSDRPVGMELLPDPVGLLAGGRLTRSEDGWVVGYRVMAHLGG